MHEMGMCDAIVETALRRAAGRQVHGVRVRVGGRPVDPEVIDENLRRAVEGTVAEGATIDLVLEPLSVHCRTCGERGPAGGPSAPPACPSCGGADIETTGREDVVLESITVDGPPP